MVCQRMPGHMPPARREMRFVQRRGDMMNLEKYDKKQMAVVVAVGGVRKVLRGSAFYVSEPAVGNCLRIVIADEDGLEILLKEDEWSGTIVKDEKYGCDFCVSLDPTWCAN
jgi:hypothetical protein